MLFFLILSIAQAINADNKYSTHIFDSIVQNNYTKYPELYAIQNVQESIQKQITLKDGRKVICQIPIPQLTKPFNITQLKILRNLTEEESNYYLFPLEDQCIQHKTKEFIYEYCFKKYIRQFDDLTTMTNMQKILKEDFSLGLSQSYIKGTNLSTGIHQPQNSKYYIDTNYHQTIQQVDQLIIIDECFAKLRNYNSVWGKNNGYQISVSTENQNYNFTVQVVIHNQLLLLQQCSDQLIISDFFEIIIIPQQQEKFQVNQYYSYKNIIFGFELRAQEMFHEQQTLGIIYSEKVHMVQIEKIIDFCAIQVIGFKYRKKSRQSLFEIKNLVIMDTNAVYEEMKGPVLIFENILFFEWVDTMDINDYVITFENTTNVFSYIETYKIIGYQNGVAILDKQFTKGLRYFGKAFIRRNGQYNYAQNQTLFNKTINKNLNEIDLYEIEHQDVQMYIFNNSLQNFKLNVEYKDFTGITFFLNSLKQTKIPQLFIKIKTQMYEEIEVSFLTIPENNIYVKSQGGTYKQMESRYKNNTVLSYQYWIIIDNQSDKLYIGRGAEIDIVNRLLQFNMIRLNNKQSDILFEFDKKSNGMKISDIMKIPLKNFQLMQNDTIQGIFTPLNYTGFGLGQYFEKYTSGSYCKPINSTRQSLVQLQCYPGDLLRFISIEEEEVCQYKLTIGTRLLCDNDYDIVEPTEQHIMCILKK